MARNFICVISFLICVIFFSGCATTAPPRPALIPPLAVYRVTIEASPYLPSWAVAQQTKGEGRWDEEALVWHLRVGTHTLTASPQIPVVLLDGVPQRLSRPPLLREGLLLLPELLWSRWIARWAVPAAPVTPAPLLRRIILDAGHGGYDPGAIGRTGLREKSVTLDIAQRLRELLLRDGFQVTMTRGNDRFLSLSRRTDIANAENGDLFVSVHANSSRQRSVSGFEVYYLSEATDDHARALEAAENASLPSEMGESVSSETQAILWDLLYTEHRAESTELAADVCQGLKGELSSQNRGVKSARFAVLKGARMPAILVEVGFLSHPMEESKLREPIYRRQLAEGIYRGILQFKEQYGKRG